MSTVGLQRQRHLKKRWVEVIDAASEMANSITICRRQNLIPKKKNSYFDHASHQFLVVLLVPTNWKELPSMLNRLMLSSCILSAVS